VPRFSYTHKPGGTPEPLRYGGLAPTGPLPDAINFPMIRTGSEDHFSCVMMGDIQTCSNTEPGYARESIVADLASRDLSGPARVAARSAGRKTAHALQRCQTEWK